MDFARSNGETAVIVLADHGNSGFTIGSSRCKGYDKLSLAELFSTVSQCKLTASGIEAVLVNTPREKLKDEFKKYTGIDLTDKEVEILLSSKNYKAGDYTQVKNSNNMLNNIVNILNSRMCFGFTTGGHTGEEVLLSAYHPLGDVPHGHLRNVDVNKYLVEVSGLTTPLQELSDRIFAKHIDVFAGMRYTIDSSDPDFPVLKVKKGRNTLEIKAFSSVGKLNGKPFDIGSVVVYIDKNHTFYLPQDLATKL